MSRRKSQLLRMRRANQRTNDPDKVKTDDVLQWNALHATIKSEHGGEFVHRLLHFKLDSFHGRYRLGDLPVNLDNIARMMKTDGNIQLNREQILFFDTETTGLGLGTGNLPFMIGFGYYESEQFVIEQCLVRHPGEEAAMLLYLDQVIQKRPILLSFNGKSFDWPILKSRFVINRLKLSEQAGKRHVDLLHPSRRLWKRTLQTCRLAEIERQILRFNRVDDVPGHLVPDMYFQFLKEKSPHLLSGVLKHNMLDILSLASLTIHFSELLSGNWDDKTDSISEEMALANWLQDLNYLDLAGFIYEKVISSPRVESGMLLQAAQYWKRRGHWAAAVSLWERCMPRRDSDLSRGHIEASIELAKYYEHKVRDHTAAFEYAAIAQQQLFKMMRQSRSKVKVRNELYEVEHRLSRLKKKMQAHATEQSLQTLTLF